MVFYWNHYFLLGAASAAAAMLALLLPETSEVTAATQWRSWYACLVGIVASAVTYALVTFVAWLRFDDLIRAQD